MEEFYESKKLARALSNIVRVSVLPKRALRGIDIDLFGHALA
jgi:hypothetical protein